MLRLHLSPFRLGQACFAFGGTYRWRGTFRAFGPRTDRHSDRRVLDEIAATLQGTWSPDTIERVADLVTATGREIRM